MALRMSHRKGESKRQHYVARLFLRQFSSDGKRICVVVNGKRIDNASLRHQCQEAYFYGEDNIMEKSFAAQESRLASFFGDFSPERFRTLSDEDVYRLRQFAALLTAARTNPILLDMNVKFIWSDRTPGFIIADHPVVACNQFAEHHPMLSRYPNITGLAVKGLQLFMPLTPSLVLAAYDPMTYEYGGKRSICRAGPADVMQLNQMQAVNAYSCFYFDHRRMDDAALRELVRTRANHPSLYTKQSFRTPRVRGEDGSIRNFIAVLTPEVRVGAKLSLVRTLIGHGYETHEGPTIPVRSAHLVEFVEFYGKRLASRMRGVAETEISEASRVNGPK